MVAEEGVGHVENIGTGESVMIRISLAYEVVVNMEVRKGVEAGEGRTWRPEVRGGMPLEQMALVDRCIAGH
jgi:hypothetical protein